MGETTNISWCDATFNPWMGCTKVSAGCANCYAEKNYAIRNFGVKWGQGQPRRLTSVGNWEKVKRWKPGTKVFCGSLCDWLDKEVPVLWRLRLLRLIWETPYLNWLLLTKRPELWRELVGDAFKAYENGEYDFLHEEFHRWLKRWLEVGIEPVNVWMGTTVENNKAQSRILELVKIPARVRFLSCEPLLENIAPIGLAGIIPKDVCPNYTPLSDKINWVIVGGESGKRARPFSRTWARKLMLECRMCEVSFFMKQMGAFSDMAALKDKSGTDPAEWPEDLRVQQFPNVQ